MSEEHASKLAQRLKSPPSQFSVPGSLPILFFGDLAQAHVATVGLNPSWREYLRRDGTEMSGSDRRFETLGSLGAGDREELLPAQIERALSTMSAYFDEGRPVYKGWFAGLARVVEGFGVSFRERSAAHLDLVQEATRPTWSELASTNSAEYRRLLASDLPFLAWQIRQFPLRAVICTSKRVLIEVVQLLDATICDEGTVGRLRWTIATAQSNDRQIGIAGWNIPLARPTGLDKRGQTEFGTFLRQRLAAFGVLP